MEHMSVTRIERFINENIDKLNSIYGNFINFKIYGKLPYKYDQNLFQTIEENSFSKFQLMRYGYFMPFRIVVSFNSIDYEKLNSDDNYIDNYIENSVSVEEMHDYDYEYIYFDKLFDGTELMFVDKKRYFDNFILDNYLLNKLCFLDVRLENWIDEEGGYDFSIYQGETTLNGSSGNDVSFYSSIINNNGYYEEFLWELFDLLNDFFEDLDKTLDNLYGEIIRLIYKKFYN